MCDVNDQSFGQLSPNSKLVAKEGGPSLAPSNKQAFNGFLQEYLSQGGEHQPFSFDDTGSESDSSYSDDEGSYESSDSCSHDTPEAVSPPTSKVLSPTSVTDVSPVYETKIPTTGAQVRSVIVSHIFGHESFGLLSHTFLVFFGQQRIAKCMSPQGYLDTLCLLQGYSTSRFETLQTAYYNKPTALQKASYDEHIVNCVKNGDEETFRSLIHSCISPNPCNEDGESLVHLICRTAQTNLLEIIVEAGGTLQVSDDNGRNPLHEACSAEIPCFAMVRMILDADPRLVHFTDKNGAVPLSFVKKEHYPAWIDFLWYHKDLYWPYTGTGDFGKQGPPELALLDPHTRPIPDPEHALTKELASVVASGKMDPTEANLLKYETENDESDEDESESAASDLYDEDESILGEDELAEILADLSF